MLFNLLWCFDYFCLRATMPVLPPVSVFVLDVCRSSLALPCDGVLSSAEQHSRVSELVECVRCGVLEYAYLARPYPEVQSGNQQPLSVIAIVSYTTPSSHVSYGGCCADSAFSLPPRC